MEELSSQCINCVCCQGKQEDAEEFLGSILDGLHEEMVEAKKAVSAPENDGDSNSAGEGM